MCSPQPRPQLSADELDPAAYARASDLRTRLAAAARARSALDAAARGLAKAGRSQDADAVTAALAEARPWEDLGLAADAARAREALARWRAVSEGEARLARALAEGAGPVALARAIQEAAAAGANVAGARRVLKLVQALDATVAAAAGALGSGASGGGDAGTRPAAAALRAKLEAARAGGAAAPLLAPGEFALGALLAEEARAELEAALRARPGSSNGAGASASRRAAALRAALSKAEEVLGAGAAELAAQEGRPASAAAASEEEGGEAVQSPARQQLSGDEQPEADQGRSRQPVAHSVKSPRATAREAPGEPGGGGGVVSTSSRRDPAAPRAAAADRQQPGASARSASAASSLAASDPSSVAVGPQKAVPGAPEPGSSSSSAQNAPAAAAAAATCAAPPVDPARLAVVRELAVAAWRVLEADEREAARLERERAAAEHARRDALKVSGGRVAQGRARWHGPAGGSLTPRRTACHVSRISRNRLAALRAPTRTSVATRHQQGGAASPFTF
jgi:hypothetical protein